LPVRSCLIDGEAIVSDEAGLAVFDLIRSWPTSVSAVLCAFDLLGGRRCLISIKTKAACNLRSYGGAIFSRPLLAPDQQL
jgi:hypothetical protein